jgi:hypothetical protein
MVKLVVSKMMVDITTWIGQVGGPELFKLSEFFIRGITWILISCIDYHLQINSICNNFQVYILQLTTQRGNGI